MSKYASINSQRASSRHPYYYMLADDERPVNYARTGPGSKENYEGRTVLDSLDAIEQKCANRVALAVERPCPPLKQPFSQPWNKWMKWTWGEYIHTAKLLAKGLISLGVQQFDTVAIYSNNRPEWYFTALGTVYTGAKIVGVYPTDELDHVQYKLAHSDAKVVIVEDKARLLKVLKALEITGNERITKLRHIVVLPPDEHKVEESVFTYQVGEDATKPANAKGSGATSGAKRGLKCQTHAYSSLLMMGTAFGNDEAKTGDRIL